MMVVMDQLLRELDVLPPPDADVAAPDWESIKMGKNEFRVKKYSQNMT